MPFNVISSLDQVPCRERVLVITGCSKRKMVTSAPVPARSLYLGNLFRVSQSYADVMGFDFAVLSARYGLLFADDPVVTYDQVLKTKKDVEAIRSGVEERLASVLDRYDVILVITGQRYRDVLDPISGDRFYTVQSRGIGELCQIVRSACRSILPGEV